MQCFRLVPLLGGEKYFYPLRNQFCTMCGSALLKAWHSRLKQEDLRFEANPGYMAIVCEIFYPPIISELFSGTWMIGYDEIWRTEMIFPWQNLFMLLWIWKFYLTVNFLSCPSAVVRLLTFYLLRWHWGRRVSTQYKALQFEACKDPAGISRV